MRPAILIMDKHEASIKKAEEIFSREFTVFTAGCYDEALAIVMRSPVSVVIADSSLDTGCRLLGKINALDKSIVFIYLAESDDAEIGLLEKGATDIVIKPVKPKVLEARVKNYYQLSTYEKGLESIATEKVEALKLSLDKLDRTQKIILDLLTNLINYRDSYTSTLSGKTTKYVEMIIKKLRENPKEGYVLDPVDEADIISFSQIRDIGKLSVPDSILTKKGFLTEYEFDIIQKHALLGAQILSDSAEQHDDVPFWKTARDIILYHHEKWDGNGYPQKLKGEEIPLSARIVSIVDVFGALINSKEYRDPFSYTYALNILREGRGRNFDPYLLDIFIGEQEKILAEI